MNRSTTSRGPQKHWSHRSTKTLEVTVEVPPTVTVCPQEPATAHETYSIVSPKLFKSLVKAKMVRNI